MSGAPINQEFGYILLRGPHTARTDRCDSVARRADAWCFGKWWPLSVSKVSTGAPVTMAISPRHQARIVAPGIAAGGTVDKWHATRLAAGGCGVSC